MINIDELVMKKEATKKGPDKKDYTISLGSWIKTAFSVGTTHYAPNPFKKKQAVQIEFSLRS